MSLTLASAQCEQEIESAKNLSGSYVAFSFGQCKRALRGRFCCLLKRLSTHLALTFSLKAKYLKH